MMRVPYSCLGRQFADPTAYLDDIQELAQSGDFVLGAAVEEFERRFMGLCGTVHAIGVNSGTDALFLSLKALGVGPGDEVITVPNSFVATVGAIVAVGAKPVFVDVNGEYTMDAEQVEGAITPRTRAVLPVHLTGNPADMPAITDIARRHGLAVVEDAAQAVLAAVDGKPAGTWGDAGCFSLHPLKNLNVWGDGGVVVTRSAELCEKLRLLRNHGLATRDEVVMFGYNSRLDSLQALVASRAMDGLYAITEKRVANARRYDRAFADLGECVTVPPRRPNVRQVFSTYVVRARDRDGLLAHLLKAGIEAKVHYPVPLHLQPAAACLSYRKGDFPVCEEHCRTIITLPVHQHLTPEEIDYVIERVREFYV
jgi:dTDP-4-amino-4,6-dideoxygalactose transaminase